MQRLLFCISRVVLILFLLYNLLNPLQIQRVHAQEVSFQAQVNNFFTPTTIGSGGTSVFTITFTNPNNFPLTLSTVPAAIANTLPDGVTIANPANASTDCVGGTVSIFGTTISLIGGTVPAAGAGYGLCSVSVNVTSTLPTTYYNTIDALTLVATDPTGTIEITNQTPSSTQLVVSSIKAPSISKTISPNTQWIGQDSTLSITIRNNDLNYSLTQLSLTDNLPTNIKIAGTPGVTYTPNCGTPTIDAPAGGSAISVTNATIPKNVPCVISVKITSSTAGVYLNSIPARAITTQQGVTNASAATAPINFQSVGMTKTFGVANFQVGGSTTMSIKLENPTSSAYNSVAFVDNMPSGITLVSATPSQCSGTVAIDGGGQRLTFSGGTIPAGTPTVRGSCTITATVTGSIAGRFTNSIPANSITTSTPGVTNVSNITANIEVYNPGAGITNPSKSFSPSAIKVGGTSTLTIRVRAPADITLTNFSLDDALPVGVKVAATPAATKGTNCQGGTFSPSVGATLLTYSGGTIPAGLECVLTVVVTSDSKGVFTNTISAANISNDQGRNVTSSFSANLTVSGLSVSKAFYPTTVNLTGISTLTVTLTNTNSNYLEDANFIDTLPVNIRIASDANVRSTCGGSVTATANATSFSLTDGIVPAQVGSVPGICTISVDVVGYATGTRTNRLSVGTVSGTLHDSSPVLEITNPTEAVADITVATITIGVAKDFAAPGQVNMGSSSKLTVKLTNENNVQLTGVSFTDNLPTHPTVPGGRLMVADPANTSTGGCGGTITVAADKFSFTFNGGSLAANEICSLSLDITSNVRDGLTNTIPIGAVRSTNGATNTLPAVATLNNIPGAVVIKKFVTNPIASGEGNSSLMEISIKNVASFPLTNVGVLDVLPVGLTPLNDPLSVEEAIQCGGTVTYDEASRQLRLTNGVVGVDEESTCTLQLEVTAPTAGNYQNCIEADALTNDEGATNDLACDTLSVEDIIVPPSIAKSFLTDPVMAGSTSPLRFTITNSNSVTLTGIAFSDILPTGLKVATPPNIGQCNGTVTVTTDSGTGQDTITLANGSIAANSSCLVTVGTKADQGGLYENVTSVVVSTESEEGNTASDDLTVISPPQITKSFTPSEITRGETSTLTFTITNPDVNTVALTGVSFTDPLPVGVKVADAPNIFVSPNCGSSPAPTFAPLAGATSLSFSGGTIAKYDALDEPPLNVCTFSVEVTAPFGGTYVNTTGTVTSTNGGNGNTATNTLVVNGVGLSLVKTTTSSYFKAVGDTITYDYLLRNTGSAVLYAPFIVSDNKIIDPVDCGNSGLVTSLAPNETTTCSATYTIVASDVTAKSISNVATATAQDAETGGGDVDSNESSVTLPLARLTLDKTTTTTGYRVVGNLIDYTYTLTNTGSIALYGPFEVSDDHFGGGTAFTCGSATILPPSGVTSCTKSGTNRYTVVEADVTNGSVINIATATAKLISTSGPVISSNSDSVTVYKIVEPVISKSFSPNPIAVGGTSLLTFTITNPNSVSSLSGVAFSDTFPTGMTRVDNPAGAQCGGTVTSTETSISLSDGFIIPSGSCMVNILVTAAVPQTYANVSGTVSSTNGGTGNTASDTLTVLDAPVISKSFSPTSIQENGTSTLTISVTNPTGNTGILTGVAFTDTFPSGLIVQTPPNIQISPSCGSPTFAPTADATSLSFSDGTIAVGGTCTVSVDVTAPFGVYDNHTGPVTSTNGGTGVGSNVATLSVNEAVDLSVTKTDGQIARDLGENVTYTIEVLNAGPSVAIGATVYDVFPSSLVSPTWTCVAEAGASCTANGSGTISDVVNLPAGKKVTYTVRTSVATNTETDIKNTASVVPPTGLVDSNEANNFSQDVNGLNELTIEKSVTETDFDELGSKINYSYKITNSGTSTLYAPFTVEDDLTEVVCTDLPASLEPDEFFTCSSEYVVTQSDLDSGFITNKVIATAKDGDGDTVTSNEATKTISGVQGPLIGVAKEVKRVEKVSAGTHDITMSILILNYGNVTLHEIQITDDLTDTFPLPTTFSVKSVTSSDLTVNPDYDGDGDVNLLLAGNTLDVGQSKVIDLVVTVIPTTYGPYTNTAMGFGTSPEDVEVSDLSQDGVNPDPDMDHDPTNNNESSPVEFDAHMFDPPYGMKTLDDTGRPVLKWTMVWINDTNIVDVNATVHDPIPEGTIFTPDLLDSGYGVPADAPDGSTSFGVSCTSSSGTTTELCYYEGPTPAHLRGQIIWKGVLGPDLGVTDPTNAQNAISITFGVTVQSTTVVRNEATIDSDINGDGDATDSNERFLVTASYVWDVTPGLLPDSGYAPDRISLVPKYNMAYDSLGDLWLEIPELEVKIPIVGVPVSEDGWDVSWLGSKAGWLNGTAYPTAAGNSLITGHVYLSNGKPGPFIGLGTLHWGDKVIIHFSGKEYVYEVREVKQVLPENRSVYSHEENPWLTLVTCQGYDEVTGEYTWRRIVRAVLISVSEK